MPIRVPSARCKKDRGALYFDLSSGSTGGTGGGKTGPGCPFMKSGYATRQIAARLLRSLARMRRSSRQAARARWSRGSVAEPNLRFHEEHRAAQAAWFGPAGDRHAWGLGRLESPLSSGLRLSLRLPDEAHDSAAPPSSNTTPRMPRTKAPAMSWNVRGSAYFPSSSGSGLGPGMPHMRSAYTLVASRRFRVLRRALIRVILPSSVVLRHQSLGGGHSQRPPPSPGPGEGASRRPATTVRYRRRLRRI